MDRQKLYVAVTAGAFSIFLTLAALKIKNNLVDVNAPVDPEDDDKEFNKESALQNISFIQREKDKENVEKQKKLQSQLNDDLFIIGIIKP